MNPWKRNFFRLEEIEVLFQSRDDFAVHYRGAAKTLVQKRIAALTKN
jgi:hypothetical protein